MTVLIVIGFCASVLAAVLGVWRASRLWCTVLSVSAGLAWIVAAVAALGGATLQITFPLGPHPLGVHLDLTPLSAVFVLLIAGTGILASVYGFAYIAHLPGPKQRLVLACLPLFLLAMVLVALAANAIAFLIAWEGMSLASYALVMTDGERPEVVRAGYIYLVMTHIGAICLLAAFLLLANATGSMDFAVWRDAAGHMPAALRSLVFLLLLLGFGSKAALVPLHVWLPRAHPVAPSHVSGLMSGVMLKVAIYGFIRIGFGVLGSGPSWWGMTVLGLGIASAVLGVLSALMEHDLKRLLAYHSVENVGIIAMGLGVALLAQSLHLPLLAAIALVAALLHTVNHALFKTALFFDAGAMQSAGAGRHLDRMGGLLKRMPWTGISLLIAAAAISGLPPLNGVVSEWLVYQSLIHLASAGRPVWALWGFAGILGLALTGGLAAACFIKVCGLTLLGRPRTPRAAAAREVPAAMYVPGLVLAGLCLAVGLAPGLVVMPLTAVAAGVLHLGALPTGAALTVALPWGAARMGPAPFGAMALGGALVVAVAVAAGRRWRPAPARSEPWACGGVLDLQSQYTATSYAHPFRIVFGVPYQPAVSAHVNPGAPSALGTTVGYAGEVTPLFERFVYGPVLRAVLVVARFGRGLQSGSLRRYLGYMLITLILVLAFVR